MSDDDLLEIEQTMTLSREEAAAKLREIADQLSRHNKLTMNRDGLRFTIDVPSQVELEVDLEIGEENELEIEIRW